MLSGLGGDGGGGVHEEEDAEGIGLAADAQAGEGEEKAPERHDANGERGAPLGGRHADERAAQRPPQDERAGQREEEEPRVGEGHAARLAECEARAEGGQV